MRSAIWGCWSSQRPTASTVSRTPCCSARSSSAVAWAGSPSPWKVSATSARPRGPLTTSPGVPGASGATTGTTAAGGDATGVGVGAAAAPVGVGDGRSEYPAEPSGGSTGPGPPVLRVGPGAHADSAPTAVTAASRAAVRSTERRSAVIATSIRTAKHPYESEAPDRTSAARSTWPNSVIMTEY